MACVILVGLFVQYEFSYDKHHANINRIYQVHREIEMENATMVSSQTSGPVAPMLKNDFPEVELAARASLLDAWIQNLDSDQIFQQWVFTADPEILKIFTIPFLSGQPETLEREGSIVLTESMAHKYFGNSDPLGKTLKIDHVELTGEYRVTGVVRDFPPNSTFRFDCLTTTPKGRMAETWNQWRPTTSYRPYRTFVLLPEEYDYRDFERKLPDFMARYMGEDTRQNNRYVLEALSQAYLYRSRDLGQHFPGYGDIKQVYAFGLIATFILLLACINFMNLATARSTKRAREVGLRKVVGAFRQQLIAQFLGESLLMALIALTTAVVTVELVLPYFNAFVQKDLTLHSTQNLWWLFALLGLGLCAGILAGSYPAFILSSFTPALTIKSHRSPNAKHLWLRKGLVVFQFVSSIVFTISAIVVHQQLNYVHNKNLGFDRERVVRLDIFWKARQLYRDGERDLRVRYQAVKQSDSNAFCSGRAHHIKHFSS